MSASIRSLYIIAGSLILVTLIIWAGYALLNYPVEHIEISESSKQNRDEDKIYAILKDTLHTPWLLLNVAEIEQRVQTLSWVDQVSISKSNLGELLVEIEPETPVFRWKKGYFLSSQGELMSVDDELWSEYELLAQVESSTKNLVFLTELESLISHLSKNKMGDLHKIRISLHQKMELFFERYTLVVDAADANESLLRFARWMNQLPKNVIQHRHRIDLRYTDGFAVSLP